jgi:hypothetical protein
MSEVVASGSFAHRWAGPERDNGAAPDPKAWTRRRCDEWIS